MRQGGAMGAGEWAILLVLSLVWGASFVFLKVLVEVASPLAIVAARLTIAAVAVNLIARGAGFSEAVRRRWVDFLILGVLSTALPFSLITFGETRISSGLASILNATTPIFTAMAAHAFTVDEKLSWNKVAGVVASFVGVAVLVGPSAFSVEGRGALPGELACLAASAVYGLAAVYGRRFSGIPPIQVASGQLAASALVMIPVALAFGQPWLIAPPGPAAWGSILGLSLVSTAFAYLFYFRLLATVGATNVSLVTFLVPVSALFLGFLLLGERIEPRALGGLAIIGLGLAALDGRLFRRLRRSP